MTAAPSRAVRAIELTFADFTRVLAKATAEPRVADLLEWCRETKAYPHFDRAMSVHGVRFEPSDRLSDLKARIGRFEEREIRKGETRSRYFDVNRLITFRQMLRTIEQYERSA